MLISVRRMRLPQHSSKTWHRAKLPNKKQTRSTRKKVPRSRRHPKNGKDPKDQLSVECKYCGNKHEWKRHKYPAYGKTCSLCGKANHFAAKCSKNSRKSKKRRSQKIKRKKVNQLDDNTESSYSSEEEILSVSLDHTANAVICQS